MTLMPEPEDGVWNSIARWWTWYGGPTLLAVAIVAGAVIAFVLLT